MRSFKTFYTEGKQVGVIYHYTSFGFLIGILTTNQLGKGTIKEGRLHTPISFTRDKHFHKGTHKIGVPTDNARIVLDGDRIANNYKIEPYDYWRDPKRKLYKIDDLPKHQEEYDEKEEKMWTPLKNLDRYIIRIELFKEKLDDMFHYLYDKDIHGVTMYMGLDKYMTFLTEESYIEFLKNYAEVELI